MQRVQGYSGEAQGVLGGVPGRILGTKTRVGQMAQDTPPQRTRGPSQVASIDFIVAVAQNFKSNLFKIIFRHEFYIITIEPQIL